MKQNLLTPLNIMRHLTTKNKANQNSCRQKLSEFPANHKGVNEEKHNET